MTLGSALRGADSGRVAWGTQIARSVAVEEVRSKVGLPPLTAGMRAGSGTSADHNE